MNYSKYVNTDCSTYKSECFHFRYVTLNNALKTATCLQLLVLRKSTGQNSEFQMVSVVRKLKLKPG